MPDWNPKANDLFLKALEIEDAAARAAFLAGFDAELRQQVEALLQAHADAGTFLNPPQPPTDIHVPQETAGTVIAGKYKLLERIGEGGMGSVWMADQLQPVKRRVAVKLIKTGMDSKSVLARFEAERQALAMMDHPNIAKILDGGITEDGSPFFVMELVKGTPITKFCDARKLSVQERLELFVPVCQAIQHAHMKGIIHRDIKPSNVLVALYDDKPVPKVIDFGIAKAAGQPLTDRTLATGFGAIVGTPEYMSPEQASFNQLDVDTRSDVYSLGVLLYELLTGAPPIDRAAFAQGAILKILEMVREVEPPRPSTKFSTKTAQASIAALRGLEPSRLAKLLRGELDWVVMKALEKDRTRRYESANGLGSDVQRYLCGEAVLAYPPSTAYRLRKFARRNKSGLVAAMIVAVALLIGGLGIGWQIAERRHAEDIARENARFTVRSALEKAEAALKAGRLTEVDSSLAVASARLAESPDDETKKLMSEIERDRNVVAELEKILESRWTFNQPNDTLDKQGIINQYRKLFASYGLSVALEKKNSNAFANGSLQTSELLNADVEIVRQSRITVALINGMSDWFFLEPKLEELRIILDRLDPNDFRISIREAIALGNEKRVLDLSSNANVALLTPEFAANLGFQTEKEGFRILEAAINRWPDSFPLNLAICAHIFTYGDNDSKKNREMEFLGRCRAAIALRPTSAVLWYYMSRAFEDLDDERNQCDALEKAIRLDPLFVSAYVALGFTLWNDDKHLQEAIALFRKALKIQPDNFAALTGLSYTLAQHGDAMEAAQVYREMKAVKHQNAGLNGAFAWGVNAAGGVEVFIKALNNQGRFVEAYKLCCEFATNEKKQRMFGDATGNAFLYGACASVQIASDTGNNSLPVQEKLQHRNQALNWLSTDLAIWQKHFATDQMKHREPTYRRMTEWLTEPLLAPVREDIGVAILPAEERSSWEKFWKSVRELQNETESNVEKIERLLRQYEKSRDAAGCRNAAEKWEELKQTDAISFYNAACFRAVTAKVIKQDSKTPKADMARLASQEVDRAIAWLKKAIDAGFKDYNHMNQDSDLDALRDRGDFKRILADLEKKESAKNEKP